MKGPNAELCTFWNYLQPFQHQAYLFLNEENRPQIWSLIGRIYLFKSLLPDFQKPGGEICVLH